MGISLSEEALRLVDGRNYAVLATVNPDGSPQTSVVWIGRDGADLLFSTVAGRVKHRNMLRDPRVSVTVIDSATEGFSVMVTSAFCATLTLIPVRVTAP